MLASKLVRFRQSLQNAGLQLFIVMSNDAHASEYVSAKDNRRKYISGFSGSAGTALIGLSDAYLWTDGRYFTQGEQELSGRPDSESWDLMRSGHVLELGPYLVKKFASCTSKVQIGIDANFITASAALDLETLFRDSNVLLTSINGTNLVDEVWQQDDSYPSEALVPCVPHPLQYSGVSHVDKIEMVRQKLRANNAHATVISMLDEVAWLYNIRGGDVPCNPVTISYAVITLNSAHLFVDTLKLSKRSDGSNVPDIYEHLSQANITVHEYNDIVPFLTNLSADYFSCNKRIICDLNQINYNIYKVLIGDDNGAASVVVNLPSLVSLPKSIKNSVEIEGMRQAHIRDGVALSAFLYWLEDEYENASIPPTYTEYQLDGKLLEFRQQMDLFRNVSFETIAGFGSNGAIIHYRAKQSTASTVTSHNLLLVDSGGQYVDGTTDVTRTITLPNHCNESEISDHMKDCYTMVLKGHIALADLTFPMHTLGLQIDALARTHLWRVGLDYGHGTGHGVGCFLNVHEGPQGIGFRARKNDVGFVPGMITSIEPGYYEVGEFGIRIENLYVTVPADTTERRGVTKPFCRFEPLTLVPIKLNIANIALLSKEDIVWLNNYHTEVRGKLLPLLTEKFPLAVTRFMKDTEPICNNV